ncbi:MAG: sulfotransferase family 2 domain-containing protein, partial [Thermodesulfobacteriota bacterium]|nr:sulfotransferase family 2 domain-containing protein [Thermodesulfobacteriota bacterium]
MNNYCIISHKHQFIYIPIPKIACTSVLNRVAEIIHGRPTKLYKITSHRDVHLNRKNIFNSKYSELHPDTAKAVKKYKNYFKFTFTRNPFDRIHSCYVDKLSIDSYGFDNNLIKRYAQMHRGMSFVEFLKTIAGIDVEEMDEHFRPQCTFFPVNYIDFTGKLENIIDDWQQIEKIIRIDHQPLPVYNKSQEIDYYDDEAEQLVVSIYNKDFKTFGYPKNRPKKQITEKKLPLIISPASSTKIYPFKDVFLEAGDHTFLATTTGENPIIIIPYFSIRKGKGILFQIDIISPINTTLTLYYTTWDAIDSPYSRHRKANVRAGENHIMITINEQAIAGRLRFTPASQPASFEINKIEISEHTLPWLEDK